MYNQRNLNNTGHCIQLICRKLLFNSELVVDLALKFIWACGIKYFLLSRLLSLRIYFLVFCRRGTTVAIKKAKVFADEDEEFFTELAQEAEIMRYKRKEKKKGGRGVGLASCHDSEGRGKGKTEPITHIPLTLKYSSLRHPNVLQFLGTASSPPELVIVMEFMSRGSLYRIIHDKSIDLPWLRVKHIALDISRGMVWRNSL